MGRAAGFDLGRRLRERAGPGAIVERACGRVNLIGEHTDYNEGFALPVPIDRHVWVAAVGRDDRKLIVHSENFGETVTLDLDEIGASPRGDWSDYPQGVARALLAGGADLRGAQLRLVSEIPIGSGLSSSAAVEVAVARALLAVAGESIEPERLALLCQQAENGFVGTRCGIMDQMVACVGELGHAILLDCRSLGHRSVRLPERVALVICNTMVKHDLAIGAYNRRRAECEEGVRALATMGGRTIRALRDVGSVELGAGRDRLDDVVYRRCRHVVRENRRVLELVTALERSDMVATAELMASSHASLRDDYEVSCAELDLLVDLATALPGVYGARMTGGGFGGCTVNLVGDHAVDEFRHRLAAGYRRATGRLPEILVCARPPAAGVPA
jgi:galactokinase